MSSPPDWSDLIPITLERHSAVPLFRQLYLEMRRLVLDGTLPAGSRLPASRTLAARLGVSRTAVVTAYEQLLTEGFATGRVGAGTYVSDEGPEQSALPQAVPALPAMAAPATPLSQRGQAQRGQAQRGQGVAAGPDATTSAFPLPAFPLPAFPLSNAGAPPPEAPFATGRVGVDDATLRVWRRLSMRHLRSFDPEHLGYSDPRGPLPLRQSLARYLRAARAVHCEPEQIVLLSGTQQAIDLILKVVLTPGEGVWVEDPCYPTTAQAIRARGGTLVPVPVDRQGMDVAAGVLRGPHARAAYVTPSHQFPLGVTLSMARRLELLAWAREAGAWVIEDDYDSEFRYAGRPLASLQGIDAGGRVIYLGTLSKVLFPGLRMGYAVVPPALLEPFLAARVLTDRHPPTLHAGVVADFIDQGHFAAHLRRMRQRYRIARDALAAALTRHGAGAMEVILPDQGMHLLSQLRPGLRDTAVAEAAAAAGLNTRAVSPMFFEAAPLSALMLGFTGHEPAALQAAAARLCSLLR